MAVAPKAKKILKIIVPTIPPTAISTSPFLAATIAVTISGKEVPAATIVNPIRFCDTPHCDATATAESTTNTPPPNNPANPPRINQVDLFQPYSEIASDSSADSVLFIPKLYIINIIKKKSSTIPSDLLSIFCVAPFR